jgi:pimeloyl-ACP methyl ester carboxylesterase
VDEHTIEVAGTPVFYRSVPVPSGEATPLYLHGVPTSSHDWSALLERTGGIAPDLIGFGRSGKGGHLEYTLDGLASFIERLLFELEIERATLVGHDWGAATGMVLALRRPALVERLVVCDAVPLFEAFTWPRIARMLRRPVVGELLMGSTPRWLLARTLRAACARPETLSDDWLETVWEQFDHGTQRATLRLYRSAGGSDLAGLEAIDAPTLIVWGEGDPWFTPRWADAYGARLRNADVARVPDAGHWPWLESPDAAERISEFVAG